MIFHVRAKRDGVDEQGNSKMFNEQYLFSGLSWTDIETQVAEKQEDGELDASLDIQAIAIYKVNEVVRGKGDKWWRVKYNFFVEHEKSKPKKVAAYMMVQASDSVLAQNVALEQLSKWMDIPAIESISETQIIEIYQKDQVIIEKG